MQISCIDGMKNPELCPVFCPDTLNDIFPSAGDLPGRPGGKTFAQSW